jgi:hypothetical protein
MTGTVNPAARVTRTIDFRRTYLQAITMPVQVDTTKVRAVAEKNT